MDITLTGVFTALITPFKGGTIDEDSLCQFVEWQIDNGVHGIVPCGTTGEASTLGFNEYCKVIELCISISKKRVLIIPGTGTNCTEETIRRTQFAETAGADAVLIVAPYYNKPTQDNLYHHFKAIHDTTSIPIVLYNVPGRCGIDITNDTVIKIIRDMPRVIGLKDSTGDLNRPIELNYLLSLEKKTNFYILSGEDSTALIFNIHGGSGCISVTSNVVPKLCAEMQNLFFSAKIPECMKINNKLFQLNKILFCQTNPIPVKYAVSLIHKNISPKLRLPLAELEGHHKVNVKCAVESLLN